MDILVEPEEFFFHQLEAVFAVQDAHALAIGLGNRGASLAVAAHIVIAVIVAEEGVKVGRLRLTHLLKADDIRLDGIDKALHSLAACRPGGAGAVGIEVLAVGIADIETADRHSRGTLGQGRDKHRCGAHA